MELLWLTIDEFPNYSVSALGDIVNEHTGRLLKQSTTMQGAVKVNLIKGGIVCTRSVKVLVAEAFVPRPDEICDTAIHLDGDQLNNKVNNLEWRPRWFAWKYARQFANLSDVHNQGPVKEIKSKKRYLDVYEASIQNGLLFVDVWRSIRTKEPVYPTRQVFDFV